MLRPAFVAFAVTIALEPLLLVALRWGGVIDVPNARSSHDRPTPRGGGLAPACGVLAALAISPQLSSPSRLSLLLVTLVFAFLGLADDVSGGLSPVRRLALQGVCAAVAVPWLLDEVTSPLGLRIVIGASVALWLVAYVNAFNFMDGINGISTAQASVAGLAWCWIGVAENVDGFAAGGAIVAGAALAFCPFNFPRAYVFLGDVGSYTFGVFIAALAVMGIRAGIAPEAVLAPLALYAADTGMTLVRRFRLGEVLHKAHREHTYQRLVDSGFPHSAVTVLVLTFIVACSCSGALSLTDSGPLRMGGGLAVLMLVAAYLATPSLAVRRPVLRGRTSTRKTTQP